VNFFQRKRVRLTGEHAAAAGKDHLEMQFEKLQVDTGSSGFHKGGRRITVTRGVFGCVERIGRADDLFDRPSVLCAAWLFHIPDLSNFYALGIVNLTKEDSCGVICHTFLCGHGKTSDVLTVRGSTLKSVRRQTTKLTNLTKAIYA